MLFTPKKYGKDWTQFLAITSCVASLGFAFFAIVAAWSHYDDLSDKVFSVLAFILGSIVFGSVGRDQWRKASKMNADEGPKP